MFAMFRRARTDLATMKSLLPAAEQAARHDGVEQPGAEHLLLASLDLDDRVAVRALGAFDVDAAALRSAIEAQHVEALSAIGVAADDNAIAAALPTPDVPRGIYRSQGSLQSAFQAAVALAKNDKASVNSGHVLLAVTDAEHGTAVRALGHLGVDLAELRRRTHEFLAAGAAGSGH